MSAIAPFMIDRFNEMIADNESVLRLYKAAGNDYAFDIRVVKDEYIEAHSLVYPTKPFYEMLNNYFRSYGIVLTYNNTGTTFWSH